MVGVRRQQVYRARCSRVSLALVGLGVIGSYLAALLARLPGVVSMLLVDPDRYDESNVAVQNVRATDVGLEKVEVQARNLTVLAPHVQVETRAARVEHLPRGLFRGRDILVGAVDSRAARQYLNEIAVHHGLRYLDGGVEGSRLVAGVSLFVPDAQRPCLECTWSDREYEGIEQVYPCRGLPEVPASGAPAELGVLAAALLAGVARRLLAGDPDLNDGGLQIVHDAAHHHSYATRVRRLSTCRLPHVRLQPEPIARVPGALSLADLWGPEFAGSAAGHAGVCVEGAYFALGAVCGRCGWRTDLPRLGAAYASARCPRCRSLLQVPGMARRRVLRPGDVAPSVAGAPLSRLAIREREIIGVCSESTTRWLELSAHAEKS